ncbi:MAG TPA: serine/threonine-protein kinase, partial [Chloroflexia bacterium]|nr:serine/threonine-protein kinase [Chloroflexia bacterium]
MADLLNTQMGQYRLTEVIRRGGMATVYKAYQESLDRYVAIKVLFHNEDPQFAMRFKREARAMAHLQHPNILPIYDHGEQDGMLFLVLQYVERGVTLSDMLGKPVEPVPALRLMARVLDALDYAHQRGIVHRDIKPGNILMPAPNWPMLADFGIAKLLTEGENQNLTSPSLIIGTPAYLAPEQALGQPIDGRTDLYSTGVVLYQMVAGHVPFDSGTPVVVLTKQAYEAPPPPTMFNPDLPPTVALAVLRALEKDPANRYQSAAEMASALEQIAADLEAARSTPAPVESRPAAGAPSELHTHYLAGVQAFAAQRWDQAAHSLRQVVAVDPTYENAGRLLDAALAALQTPGAATVVRTPATSPAPAESQAAPAPLPADAEAQAAPLPASPPPAAAPARTAPAGEPAPPVAEALAAAEPDAVAAAAPPARRPRRRAASVPPASAAGTQAAAAPPPAPPDGENAPPERARQAGP